MKDKFLYLAIDILVISIPLSCSFYSKSNFSRKWKFVLPAILVTSLVFILWDELFTRQGVWGFNRKYVSGIYFLSLPLEEVLFFVCIPYACLFTYFTLSYLIRTDLFLSSHKYLSAFLVCAFLVTGIAYISNSYTSASFLSAAGVIAINQYLLKSTFMGKFYLFFFLILIPFSVVNGVLTGSFIDESVVWYNNHENVGIRLGTIPLEDIPYAITLLLTSITIADFLEQRALQKKLRPTDR